MRLADFIETNAEGILSTAERFTATLLPAAANLDSVAMRDHMPLMLGIIVADLRSDQTAEQQLRKSLGQDVPLAGSPATPAQLHAVLRAKDGFDIEQVVGEYRALRASILLLWLPADGMVDAQVLRDVARFNEAMDQALAESVSSFAAEAARWRHIFLAVLGHDLRGPLNAILLTAELLTRLGSEAPTTRYMQSLMRSGKRMQQLLDSLLDFSRASLGRGIRLVRTSVDLAAACAEEVEVLRASLPDREITLAVEGVSAGSYDGSRIREVLGNLVHNAAKYSIPESPIRIRLVGDERRIRLSVENAGIAISPAELQLLFEPLARGRSIAPEDEDRSNLGLGLFIVQEIAKAHGGSVDATSRDGLTTFTVTLPFANAQGRVDPSDV